MDERPEIVFFAENKLGGVQSFYDNLIRFSETGFDIKWILVEVENDPDAKPIKPFDLPHQVFKIFRNETAYQFSERLSELVSDRPGAVVTNFPNELTMLHLHRKKNKTIYFICHDELYVNTARDFEFLIDVFIAHNPFFFQKLKALFPRRAADVFYIPYGIVPRTVVREVNYTQPLRLLFLARLHFKKGIYDLVAIDEKLTASNIPVQWTIIGNGPERDNFKKAIAQNPRFTLCSDLTNEEITAFFPQQDVFVLPSVLDGVPLAMLETMSAGIVPVIYRFNEGIGMIFPDEAIIVDTGDADAMAQGIALLHQDRKRLESYSIKCKDVIHQKYEVRARNNQYFNLFERYKSFKKPLRKKVPGYGGMLSHPAVPSLLRDLLRRIKRIAK